MHLAFIGMSGIGKSHWAKQLAQRGWLHLDCDRVIAERLGDIIEVTDDEDPVHAVGRWMGMPWSPGYAEREAQYLALEREVTEDAIDLATTQLAERNVVLDTTGSVIYTGDELLDQLRRETRVVFFDAPDAVREQMVALYRDEPKPVLWQGAYRPGPAEPRDEALARCYAGLLVDRAQQYRQLADVTVAYHAARVDGFDLAAWLQSALAR